MSSKRLLAYVVTLGGLFLLPWAVQAGFLATVSGAEPAANSTRLNASLAQSYQSELAARNLTPRNDAGMKFSTQELDSQFAELQLGQRNEIELTVKFRDFVRARADQAAAGQVRSERGADLGSFRQIVQQHGLSVTPAINKSEQTLQTLQHRAASKSGRAQPDLAGMVSVTGPAAVMRQVALDLNALETVEFVEFAAGLEPAEHTGDPRKLAMQRDADQVRELQRERMEEARQWEIARDAVRGFLEDNGPPKPEMAPRNMVDIGIDTGFVSNDKDPAAAQVEPEVVATEIVRVEDAPWMQVHFADVLLSGSPRRGTGSFLKLTSLRDGGTQFLDAETIEQWRYRSAYFNGDEVLVELMAYPGTGDNRVSIEQAVAGEWVGGAPLFICDNEDERELSNDPRIGRVGLGCSSWLFEGNSNQLLSAGHCIGSILGQIVEFNVPLSQPDGTPVMADPDDQYPVVQDTLQFDQDSCAFDCSHDWAHFVVGDNSNTGLSPLEAQGDSFTLATSMPEAGQLVTVRGYGNTFESPAPLEWNQVQKEHTGPLVAITGNLVTFRADVTGGDSGGVVINEETGEAIAILTCGACDQIGGWNIGSSVLHPGVHHAIHNPDAPTPGVGELGACCFDDGSIEGVCFDALTADECVNSGGFFKGVGTECNGWPCFQDYVCCFQSAFGPMCDHLDRWACEGFGSVCGDPIGEHVPDVFECDGDNPPEPCFEEPECGEPNAGNCFSWNNPSPFCDNEVICDAVCEIDPTCCDDQDFPGRDGTWDWICAWHAHRIFGGPSHNCYGTTGDCLSPHTTPGCEESGCCFAVTAVDPYCGGHTYNWDALCVELAEDICHSTDPTGPTPDLSDGQGYLTAQSYLQQFGYVPSEVAPAITPDVPSSLAMAQNLPFGPDLLEFQPILGWGGEGFDLDGLWEYAESLGTDSENLTRGQSTSIGVLYPSAFVQPTDGTPETDNPQTHEDLRGRVLYPEVDQTQILLPFSPTGFLNGHAGTAVLGIIGANPDNGIGMRGMSPDAELSFFPTVSEEEGGRPHNAFTSALELYEPGDVIVMPYTPRPTAFTFASYPSMNLLFALATDSGISTVIAAGDTALPVAEQAGEFDSGAIITGASTPGFPFYRAGFSAWCEGEQEGANCEPLEAVHTAGWGFAVATLGYGDLYQGQTDGEPDPTRAYTGSFAGTGAAAAQVAAAVANLQGIPKMFYGIPLSPIQIRGEYAGNAFPQGGFTLGSQGPPGEADAPPYSDFGDWDLDEDPKVIGSIIWPDPLAPDVVDLASGGALCDLTLAAEWTIVGGFFDQCEELDQIDVIRGEHISGNLFSACQFDGLYYVGESQWTEAGSSPNTGVVPDAPLGSAAYVATGQIVDFFVQATAPSTSPGTDLEVTVQAGPVEPAGFTMIELYNFNTSQWNLIDLSFHASGGAPAMVSRPFTAGPYVRSSDARVFLRVWGYAMPGGSTPGGSPQTDPFEYPLDNVSIDFATGGFDPSGEE